MAERSNRFRLGFRATVVGAFIGLLALGLAGRRGGNRTVIPLVTQCGDSFGLAVAGITLANVSQHALCGTGRRGRDRAIIPVVANAARPPSWSRCNRRLCICRSFHPRSHRSARW